MSDIGQPHTHGHAHTYGREHGHAHAHAPSPSPVRDNFDSRLASIQRYSHAHTPSQLSQQSHSSSSSAPIHPESHMQGRPTSYIQTQTQIQPQRQSSISASSPVSQSMYASPSHPGCVLCSLVSSARSSFPASRSPLHSPSTATSLLPNANDNGGLDPYPQPFERRGSSSGLGAGAGAGGSRGVESAGKEVVFQDEDLTIYRAEGKERLCSGENHLIVVINKHLESVYDFGPSDVPMLGHIIDTARHILSTATISGGGSGGNSSATASEAERGKGKGKEDDFRVGFVGSVMRDPQCPHKHLHAHAMIGLIDTSLPGATFWRRNMVFGGVNWWSVEDLRAEIREETSNNRVKSGYEHRDRAPIDRVPDAGSVAGFPNALEVRSYQDHPSPTSPSGHRPQSQSHLHPDTRSSPAGVGHSPTDPSLSSNPYSSGKGKAPESAAQQSSLGSQMERTSSHQSESHKIQSPDPGQENEEDEGNVAVDLDDAPVPAMASGDRKDVGRGGRI
ncbi:hypothetical protein IAT40_006348 [Kwoniella sp. CBS 6097]